jgi:hypothetical protein
VNYEEAKKNNREYLDRGHANFIQTADNEIVNFDPIPRLGENIREVVKQRIMTSPKSKLSKDQRVLKDILLANPKEYQNPHMWRLVQNEYKKRTPMTENEFKEIVSQTPPLIKIAKPRWAKGNIDEVLERVKVFLSNVADDAHGIAIKPDYDIIREKDNSTRKLVKKYESIINNPESKQYIPRWSDRNMAVSEYEKKLTGASKKTTRNYIINRVKGALLDGKKDPFPMHENEPDYLSEKILSRLINLKNQVKDKEKLFNAFETKGFVTDGMTPREFGHYYDDAAMSRNPYAVKDLHTLNTTLGVHIPSKLSRTLQMDKELERSQSNYKQLFNDTDGRVKLQTALLTKRFSDKGPKTMNDLVEHPMFKFLSEHNYENNPKELKIPLKLMERLPKGKYLDKSIASVNSGIGAGADFENFNKNTRGTPHQILSELNTYIESIKSQMGRTNFLKDRPNYAHRVDEKSEKLSDALTEIKGAELAALSTPRGGKFGNVCISNKGMGCSYSPTKKDYVDATLEGESKIHTYESPEDPTFTALIYSDAKTGKIHEARGKDNARLEDHPHFNKFKEHIKQFGLHYD